VKGFATTSRPSIEVLSASNASQDDIPSVAATPGWFVVHAFYLPVSVALRLELIGLVSEAGLTMRARFFDLGVNAPVASSEASITATTDTRALGPLVELTGARLYQIQVEVTGGGGAEQVGVVRAGAATV
jgi:hypothetical protein